MMGHAMQAMLTIVKGRRRRLGCYMYITHESVCSGAEYYTGASESKNMHYHVSCEQRPLYLEHAGTKVRHGVPEV